MDRQVIILILGILFVSGFWTYTYAQENPQATFTAQIRKSCEKDRRLEKTVTDLQENQSETKVIPLDTLETPSTLEKELQYAFEYYFDNPKLREYFEVTSTGDTTLALIKPANRNSTPLHLQKILRTADGKFKFVETLIHKDFWLYGLEAHLKVWFSPEGQYEHHELILHHSVFMMGETLYSKITGKLI